MCRFLNMDTSNGCSGYPGSIIELHNEQIETRFTERHMIVCQEMINENGDKPDI